MSLADCKYLNSMLMAHWEGDHEGLDQLLKRGTATLYLGEMPELHFS